MKKQIVIQGNASSPKINHYTAPCHGAQIRRWCIVMDGTGLRQLDFLKQGHQHAQRDPHLWRYDEG